MFVETLPLRQRRAIAVGLLVVAVVALLSISVVPLAALSAQYSGRIARVTQQLATTRQILADGEMARKRLKMLENEERRHGYYLAKGGTVLAAAQLQQHIKQTVESAGGTIVSSQVLGEREDDGLGMIVLRVNMRVDIQAFEKVLYVLETRPPVLLLDNIHVASRPSGSTARWRGSAEQHVLDVSMEVMGYGNPAHDA